MLDRRRFIAGITLGLAAPPLTVRAQGAGKVAHVVFLANGTEAFASRWFVAFRAGLRDLGYVEGQSIAIAPRYAEGDARRLPGLVADILRTRPDIIVAAGFPALHRLKSATTTVPVVMAIISDPVELGLVESLAHPGENLTGLAFQNRDLATKRIELLKECAPRLKRVAILLDLAAQTEPRRSTFIAELRAAASSLGVEAHILEVTGAGDFDAAFSSARSGRDEAIVAMASPFINANRKAIIRLAATHRLPATYEERGYVDDGGLMSYGPHFADMYRRAAVFVDKILRGSLPADLPIEQSTKFELVINLRTARALGLTIPASLLLRADQVIE